MLFRPGSETGAVSYLFRVNVATSPSCSCGLPLEKCIHYLFMEFQFSLLARSCGFNLTIVYMLFADESLSNEV